MPSRQTPSDVGTTSRTSTPTVVRSLPREFLLARRTLSEATPVDELGTSLRAAGFRIGETLYARFCDWLSLRGDATPAYLPDDVMADVLTEFFVVAGWGTVRLSPLTATILVVETADWCESLEGTRDCVVSTGLFAGFFGQFVGAPVSVMEVECRGSGHPACRFLLGGDAELRAVHAAMLRGLPYGAAVPSA